MSTPAPRKSSLEVRALPGESAVCLHLSGMLDERFSAEKLLQRAALITVLDLEGITRITSFGVRQWADAMSSMASEVQHIYLINCPPCFIDQLNLVFNFGGRAEVLSAQAPFFCDQCLQEYPVTVDVLAGGSTLATTPPQSTCPTCSRPLKMEEDPREYFAFAKTHGARSLDPAAASLLQINNLFHFNQAGRAPETSKQVHGEVTLIEIAGHLDERLRPRRLVDGVEGHVVVDLAGVEGMDATGTERWMQLLRGLRSASSSTVVELPEQLLPALADGLLPFEGAQLYTLRLQFRCQSCSATQAVTVRARDAGGSLSASCRRCAMPSLALASAELLAAAARIAGPTGVAPPVEEFLGRREELVSRARAQAPGGKPSSAQEGLDRYRVMKRLSEGGMAEVLLAVHKGIGGFEKLVALKKIRGEMLARRQIAVPLFLNEAKIAANLNHPNIVQVYEIGEHGGDLFIAMEYLHGADARAVLQTACRLGRPLTLDQVLYIGAQVATGLHYAHTARDLAGRELQIVHRDVSLSNIVVGFDGQVKLVDFGIASAAVVDGGGDALVGKFSYMSPEQIRREPLDGRSDVFSLGIVLWELLTGKPLFRRRTDEETLTAVLEGEIPALDPHRVPGSVEQVLRAALAGDRDKRYPDARALAMALEAVRQKLGGVTNAERLAQLMRDLLGEQRALSPAETSGEWSQELRSSTYQVQPAPWELTQGVDDGPEIELSLGESAPTTAERPEARLQVVPAPVPPSPDEAAPVAIVDGKLTTPYRTPSALLDSCRVATTSPPTESGSPPPVIPTAAAVPVPVLAPAPVIAPPPLLRPEVARPSSVAALPLPEPASKTADAIAERRARRLTAALWTALVVATLGIAAAVALVNF